MLAGVVRCDYFTVEKAGENGSRESRICYLRLKSHHFFLLVWFRSSPGSWELAACELDCSMIGGIVREFVR